MYNLTKHLGMEPEIMVIDWEVLLEMIEECIMSEIHVAGGLILSNHHGYQFQQNLRKLSIRCLVFPSVLHYNSL